VAGQVHPPVVPYVGSELVGNTPGEFARAIKSDLAKYAKLVKDAGIQP
jgi:tripartite-type tricarboxylate transporter receptor subunit TctC